MSTKRRRHQLRPSTTTNDDDNEQPLHRIRLKRKAGRDADHRLSAHVPDNVYKRTHLAHDDLESSRLRLVTSRLQRKVDDLRAQLEDWDPLEDHSLLLLNLEELVNEFGINDVNVMYASFYFENMDNEEEHDEPLAVPIVVVDPRAAHDNAGQRDNDFDNNWEASPRSVAKT